MPTRAWAWHPARKKTSNIKNQSAKPQIKIQKDDE
jgi:hypothetical protein